MAIEHQVGRQRHWWSPLPVPETPPVSSRRAYLEVLGVFAAFFGSGILAAGFSLADRLPTQHGGWGLFLPSAFDELAQAAVAITLVILLARNRGISTRALGLGSPRKPDGRRAIAQTVRMATWAVVALIAGSVVTAALATGRYNAPSHPSGAFLAFASTASINAGVVEELVVLGFLLVTLQQARRPFSEILLVALALRASYHIYYGPGVVGILIWGSVFVWLFLRTRSLLPLVAVHFCWDFTIFLATRWAWVEVLAVLAVFGLLVAAPLTWLVDRANRRAPTTCAGTGGPSGAWPDLTGGPWEGWRGAGRGAWEVRSGPAGAWDTGSGRAGAWDVASGRGGTGSGWRGGPAPPYAVPPGWHPDPSGQWDWRWWDGARWTDATA